MKKDVIIFFKTSQVNAEAEEENFEIITPGEYYFKREKHYLIYEEAEEGSAPVRNTIRIGKGMVEVIRNGGAAVHMTFEEGKNNYSNYQTVYGEMVVGFETTGIQITEEEDLLEVLLEYRLEIEGRHTAVCSVTLRAESKDTCKLKLS